MATRLSPRASRPTPSATPPGLSGLSGLREDRSDLHGCLHTTQRHLGLDECNEAAHRRLMRCYARLGQPQLAERQYRQCLTTLRRQLGLNPDVETTELYLHSIRSDQAWGVRGMVRPVKSPDSPRT